MATQSAADQPVNKMAKAVRLLRIGTWSVFTLVVAALLTVTVVGPFLLGNPAVTGGRPMLFGALLLLLLVGTVGFVAVSVALD